MVLGIVSLLALAGGVAGVILLGIFAFMFLRAILPPYGPPE
jgi:hypothetical protein